MIRQGQNVSLQCLRVPVSGTEVGPDSLTRIRVISACTNYESSPQGVSNSGAAIPRYPSSNFVHAARVGSSASGRFATKSKWTFATISLQCCDSVPCSSGTSASWTSKTSSAFFQDTCVTLAISGVRLAVTEQGCIPPYADPGPIHPTTEG